MNKIGALFDVKRGVNVFEQMKRLRDCGCECCQVCVWDPTLYTDELAADLVAASKEYDVEISTIWAGWFGPARWNFTEGPSTLGIVPEAYRARRCEEILEGARFAAKIGVGRVATHAGFLPENMNDPKYLDVLATLRYIATKCKEYGVCFLFETGQETPITLLRFIEEIGMDNVGINMDTANLILYGKGNSADAITVFGKYVMDTHVKDGLYPTSGKLLGRQVKVGEGVANIPEVIARLKAVGYQGNYIIEREITGEQQIRDIKDTVAFLEGLLGE